MAGPAVAKNRTAGCSDTVCVPGDRIHCGVSGILVLPGIDETLRVERVCPAAILPLPICEAVIGGYVASGMGQRPSSITPELRIAMRTHRMVNATGGFTRNRAWPKGREQAIVVPKSGTDSCKTVTCQCVVRSDSMVTIGRGHTVTNPGIGGKRITP